jgi:hypothetical protein
MLGRRPFVWEVAPAAELFRPKTRAEEETRAEPQLQSQVASRQYPLTPRPAERTRSQATAIAWTAVWSKTIEQPRRAVLTAFLQPRAPPLPGESEYEVAPRQTGPPLVWPTVTQSLQFARPPPWRDTRERKERRKSRAPPKALGGPAGINRR